MKIIDLHKVKGKIRRHFIDMDTKPSTTFPFELSRDMIGQHNTSKITSMFIWINECAREVPDESTN